MTYEEALAVATANNEIDENQTFLIDKNLRTVTIPDGFVLGVFNDKNVQIVPFAMPRYYNGIDMSTFAIQVNYVNSAGDGDIYLVFDQDVQEDLILFLTVLKSIIRLMNKKYWMSSLKYGEPRSGRT